MLQMCLFGWRSIVTRGWRLQNLKERLNEGSCNASATSIRACDPCLLNAKLGL